MKKLILVTALAVAASWLVSEPRQPGAEEATLATALDEFKAKYGDAPRQTIVLDDGETQFAPLRPAPSPEPPTPPGSIRTVPWNKRDSSPLAKSAGDEAPARAFPPRPADPSGRPSPSWFPKTEAEEEARAKIDSTGSKVLLGRLSASEDRARQDLRQVVEREVSAWLSADVPPSWKVPATAIDAMVQARFTQELAKSLVPTAPEAEDAAKSADPKVDGLYMLYHAGQKLDFSPTRRAEIVGMYRKDLAAARMQRLGGGVALALVGLAVLSGYIKADEATKGYYTNRLRLAAAAGLGAAGVAAYRFLA